MNIATDHDSNIQV